MSMNEPVVGQWYLDMRKRMFEVVATDEDSVEIQFHDGDVAEIDLDTWYQLSPSGISEPNDASGPYDMPDMDEFGAIEEPFQEDWQENLDSY